MISKAEPVVAERLGGQPDEQPPDLDFFDDLDFEERVVEQRVVEQRVVEDRVPYVLPKIVPAVPEGEPEAEPATGEPPSDLVIAEPTPKRLSPKFKLPTVFTPQFKGVTKQLRRRLQPVVLARHRPRVRRVTRVVRHIDTWSVFKIAALFNIFLYAVCLTAGVMLWRVALNTGTIENIERFFESFGWQTFQLKGGEIYHNAWIAGLFAVVGLTGLAVLAATMFNLITDLVGGVRVTVLEEEVTGREQRVVSWPRLLRPGTPPRGEPPND